MPPDTIAIEGLTKAYGTRTALRALDLRVPRGTLFGFLGPNGAGKTTAIRVLLGFLRPDRGQASVLGRDCWRESRSVKLDVGYVPGDLRLYGWMRGIDALRLAGRTRGRDLVGPGGTLAERFDLDLSVRVRAMSRGMRQKLGMILALAHDPPVLVLDEPTTALDPLAQEKLRDELRSRAARGDTVFFSSHVLSEVEGVCDRVAILREGKLVANETLDELRRHVGRAVTIVWDGPPPDTAPQWLQIEDRSGARWRCTVRGEIAPLLAWLQERAIADLRIGAPDLESLFRRYYESGGAP